MPDTPYQQLLNALASRPAAFTAAPQEGMPGFTAPYTRLADQRSMPGYPVPPVASAMSNKSMPGYSMDPVDTRPPIDLNSYLTPNPLRTQSTSEPTGLKITPAPARSQYPAWNDPALTTGVRNSPGPKSPEAAAQIAASQAKQQPGSKGKGAPRGKVTQEGINLALNELAGITAPERGDQNKEDRGREDEWISNLIAASNLSPDNARILESQYRSGLTQVPHNNDGSKVGDPLNPEREKVLTPLQNQIATLARINAGADGGASAGQGGSNGEMTAEQQMQMMKIVQDYMAPALMTAPKSQQVATRQMISAIPAYAALQNQAKVLLAQQSKSSAGFQDPYAATSYINNQDQSSGTLGI